MELFKPKQKVLFGDKIHLIIGEYKRDYWNIETLNGGCRVVHKSNLKQIKSKPHLPINLGDGDVFSNKLYMTPLLFYCTPFRGIEYHNNWFSTEVSGSIGKFKLENIPYNNEWFRWRNDTFSDDFTHVFQVGDDYIRIFNIKEISEIVRKLIVNKEGEVEWININDNVKQSNQVSSNKDMTMFGCRLNLVYDNVMTNLITKNK